MLKLLTELRAILKSYKATGLPLLSLNFIFQYLFLQNYQFTTIVHFTTKVIYPKRISYHKDKITLTSFSVSACCYFQAYNKIILGRNCLIAPGVKIISSNHSFNQKRVPIKDRPVIIGDNVWIGANAIILPGVSISDNCIIGAGAVVTRSFSEANLIIAGNPARIVKKIESD